MNIFFVLNTYTGLDDRIEQYLVPNGYFDPWIADLQAEVHLGKCKGLVEAWSIQEYTDAPDFFPRQRLNIRRFNKRINRLYKDLEKYNFKKLLMDLADLGADWDNTPLGSMHSNFNFIYLNNSLK